MQTIPINRPYLFPDVNVAVAIPSSGLKYFAPDIPDLEVSNDNINWVSTDGINLTGKFARCPTAVGQIYISH